MHFSANTKLVLHLKYTTIAPQRTVLHHTLTLSCSL